MSLIALFELFGYVNLVACVACLCLAFVFYTPKNSGKIATLPQVVKIPVVAIPAYLLIQKADGRVNKVTKKQALQRVAMLNKKSKIPFRLFFYSCGDGFYQSWEYVRMDKITRTRKTLMIAGNEIFQEVL